MSYDQGGLVAQQAAATARAIHLEVDRKMVESLIGPWEAMSEQERAELSAQAEADRERRNREYREHVARVRAAARARHVATLGRAADSTLRAVVGMHAPTDEGLGLCRGCCDNEDYDGDDYYANEVDWPCPTFLLIERAVT